MIILIQENVPPRLKKFALGRLFEALLFLQFILVKKVPLFHLLLMCYSNLFEGVTYVLQSVIKISTIFDVYVHLLPGGGLLENIPRVLPDTVGCVLDATSWEVPAVFGWLSSVGNIHPDEMLRTFNCGLGGVVIVSSEQKEKVLLKLRNSGERAWPVGVLSHAVANRSQVHVTGTVFATLSGLFPADPDKVLYWRCMIKGGVR